MESTPRSRATLWPAGLALVVGLVLTVWLGAHTYDDVATIRHQSLAQAGAEIVKQIQARFRSQAQILRNAAAFLGASGIEVTSPDGRLRWHGYIEQSRIYKNYPEVLSVAFVLWLPDSQGRDERSSAGGRAPVLYIQSFSEGSPLLVGQDLYADPGARAIMRLAAEVDRAATLIPPKTIVEAGADGGRGIVQTYVPVYRAAAGSEGAQPGRPVLLGWMASAYRLRDLVYGGNALQGPMPGGVRIAIHPIEGQDPLDEPELHDSSRASWLHPESLGVVELPLELNRQRWILDVADREIHRTTLKDPRVWLVSASGTVISLLVSALVAALARARARTFTLDAELDARLAAEARLRERDAQYRLLSDNTTDVLWMVNLDKGGWIYQSPSVERLRGYSLEEAMAQTMEDVLAPESFARMGRLIGERSAAFLSGAEGSHVYTDEVEQTCRDGGTVWTEATTRYLRNEQGDLVMLGISRDISARRRADLALREAEHKYRQIFETSLVGIFQSSPTGRLLDANQAFARILGYPSPTEVQQSVSDLAEQLCASVVDRNRLRRLLLEIGEVQGFETLGRRRDGEPLWVSVNAAVARDAKGQAEAIRGTLIDVTKRKRAEQSLDIALTKYKTLFESFPLGILVTDEAGVILEHNRIAESLTGLGKGQRLREILTLGAGKIVRTDGSPMTSHEIAEAFALDGARRRHRSELGLTGSDGALSWIGVTTTPLRLEGFGVVMTLADISEQVEGAISREIISAVAWLAVSSESVGRFSRSLPGLLAARVGYPMVVLERYDEASEEMVFVGSVGLPDELASMRVPVARTISGAVLTSGRPLVELDPFSRPEHTYEQLRALQTQTFLCVPLRIGERVIGALSLADTHRRHVADSLVQTLETVANTAADTMSRLETQTRLRESEHNYRSLIENLSGGVVVHAPDGGIRFANAMACELLGLSLDQMLAWTRTTGERRICREDGSPMPAEEYPVNLVKRTGSAHRNLILSVRHSAEAALRWMQCEAHPTYDDVGGMSQIVVTFFEITDLKLAEAELDQHRHRLETLVDSRTQELVEARDAADSANRAKSTFLANMSHEIRTPMNAIIGLNHLLLREISEPRARDLVKKVGDAAGHLLHIIDDILDLSKIEAGRLTLEVGELSVAQVIDQALRLMEERAREKGLRLGREIDPRLPGLLVGDKLRLGQVLLNFVSNAIKFSHHGEIRARARLVRDDEELVLVRIEVEDQGIGIPAEQQARLFRPFAQADDSTTRLFGGTGLGLVIARRLAELMGGECGLRSEEGVGSTFWMTAALGKTQLTTLRRPAAGPEAADEPERRLAELHGGKRLLLAEDDPINQEVAVELLRETGLVVDVVGNGQEAVEQALSGRYALVLMDMQMPVMGGLEATREIRRHLSASELPIVAMTANAFDEDRQQCLRAGMNDHVGKPVAPERLFRALLRWLPASTLDGPLAGVAGRGRPVQPQAEEGTPAVAPAAEPAALRLQDVPGLDLDQGLGMVRGNEAMYRRLLTMFVQSHGADADELRSLLSLGDLAGAGKKAHSLKGAAATLGAEQVRRTAAGLEQGVRADAASDALGELVETLAQDLECLVDAIQRLEAS